MADTNNTGEMETESENCFEKLQEEAKKSLLSASYADIDSFVPGSFCNDLTGLVHLLDSHPSMKEFLESESSESEPPELVPLESDFDVFKMEPDLDSLQSSRTYLPPAPSSDSSLTITKEYCGHFNIDPLLPEGFRARGFSTIQYKDNQSWNKTEKSLLKSDYKFIGITDDLESAQPLHLPKFDSTNITSKTSTQNTILEDLVIKSQMKHLPELKNMLLEEARRGKLELRVPGVHGSKEFTKGWRYWLKSTRIYPQIIDALNKDGFSIQYYPKGTKETYFRGFVLYWGPAEKEEEQTPSLYEQEYKNRKKSKAKAEAKTKAKEQLEYARRTTLVLEKLERLSTILAEKYLSSENEIEPKTEATTTTTTVITTATEPPQGTTLTPDEFSALQIRNSIRQAIRIQMDKIDKALDVCISDNDDHDVDYFDVD